MNAVLVTSTELAQLEAAHLRLLGGSGADVDGAHGDGDAGPGDGGATVTHGALLEARRSLVVRGLLDQEGRLLEAGDVGLAVTTMLDVRLGAQHVVAVDRLISACSPQEPRAGHVREGDGVTHGLRLVHVLDTVACVEDVLDNGAHHLQLLLDPEDHVPAVTAVTVPPDAVEADGPDVTVDPARPEALALALGHPTVLAELTVLGLLGDDGSLEPTGVEEGPAHLLALGPRGCWATDVDRGRPAPGVLVFRPVDPGWVGRWVARALRRVPAGQGTMTS